MYTHTGLTVFGRNAGLLLISICVNINAKYAGPTEGKI